MPFGEVRSREAHLPALSASSITGGTGGGGGGSSGNQWVVRESVGRPGISRADLAARLITTRAAGETVARTADGLVQAAKHAPDERAQKQQGPDHRHNHHRRRIHELAAVSTCTTSEPSA